MYYEKLALEVGARVVGLEVVKPAQIRGTSGEEHRFTFVAADGPEMYAFDVVPEASQLDILRTYVKKMDTGANAYVVCLSGRPSAEVRTLAKDYGIDVLGPGEVGDFFSGRIAQKIKAQRVTRSVR
jgi:hypothetical protein